MICKICKDTGSVSEARQRVPCPCCRWIERAAEEIVRRWDEWDGEAQQLAQVLQDASEWSFSIEDAVENTIRAHYRAAIEEQAKGVPF